MIRAAFFIVLSSLLSASPALAWDGYDSERGTPVEIGKGNLVRPGQEIEYFDYDKGEYHYGEVESIRRYGSSVEIEVYDHDLGATRTFDMD